MSAYLADIDRQAEELFRLVSQIAEVEGITEMPKFKYRYLIA